MKKMSTKKLCVMGLLIALVCVSTMVIQVPVPATSGYIHLGDSIILISSMFFGWQYGMAAGGIGSMLADLLSGYAHWSPFTLIIKGFMGFAIGKLAQSDKLKLNILTPQNLAAGIVGIAIMVVGYLLGGTILKGSFAVALTSVPSNIVQGAGGFVMYCVIGIALQKAKISRLVINDKTL